MKRDSTRRFIVMMFCLAVMAFVTFLMLSDSGIEVDAQKTQRTIMQNHLNYTGADNAVTAIYLNIRLWDTLFEALVLLVSAVAVISFSRSSEDER